MDAAQQHYAKKEYAEARRLYGLAADRGRRALRRARGRRGAADLAAELCAVAGELG